ncbi:ECF subfamily RNA polymerase sigma factor, BldN family [Streptomyces sp. NPDC060027]|uniref:ECF subfamily RNA polymerase sigma factor, BldN family n=1 Tax=Streptomyces sp. NPDC060027 TaxID=3347040 RepID=UPI0036B26B71
MWSDEAATADRLQRLLARVHSPQYAGPAAEALSAAARVRTDATATGDLSADPPAATRTLCPTGSRSLPVQDTHQAHALGAGQGSAGPAEDSGVSTVRPMDPDSASARIVKLVEQAQAGDPDAFGQLYDRYSDTVYRYIYYRVGGKETAEDLTSETFLRALRRIASFTWQGRDFGAWLVTIARNLVVDHFKSSRFRLEVTTGELFDAAGVECSPEDRVLEAFWNMALLDAVRRLTPQQQECATLRFLQGLPVAETARVMGKNEGAVRALQYRAVRGLARILDAERK